MHSFQKNPHLLEQDSTQFVLGVTTPASSVTTSELDIIKAKVAAQISPWKEAYDIMIADANNGLSVIGNAIAIWHIPGYYADPAGHGAAKARMAEVYGDMDYEIYVTQCRPLVGVPTGNDCASNRWR